MDHIVENAQFVDLGDQIDIPTGMPDFSGNYSVVYKGSLRGETVAIKIIKLTGKIESVKRKVTREVAVWGSVYHENIHPFYGFATGEAFGQFGALISPWCKNGDANQFLAIRGEQMVMTERINLWKGVLEGVIYLHEQEPPIVHGDLKPGNILIDDSGNPRICDFGLARVFLEEGSTGMTTTAEHTGTTRYLAPELVSSDVTVYPTLSSDLYALGCLGLEFIYLQKPYSDRINNVRGQIFQDIRRGKPPASQLLEERWPSNRIWPFIKNLWNKEPGLRSSASTTADAINRTAFTFPSTVKKRIAHFAALYLYPFRPWNRYEWKRYCIDLCSLCLVSRDFWAWTTPKLYREIRLYLPVLTNSSSSQNSWKTGPSLVQTLKSSTTRVMGFGSIPGGYGSYTKDLILINREFHGALSQVISPVIQSLLRFMTTLDMVIFCGDKRDVSFKRMHMRHTLPTLCFYDPGTKIIPSYLRSLLPLEFIRRLYISASDGGIPILPESLVLPNLQELAVRDIYHSTSFPAGLIYYISSWKMPRLHTVELKFMNNMDITVFDMFFRAHGHRILHLTLRGHRNHWETAHLIRLCSMNIRTITIPSFDFLTTISSLEDITVELGFRMDTPSIQPLLDFKSTASTLFPALKGAQMRWRYNKRKQGGPVFQFEEVNACASFRIGSDDIAVYEEVMGVNYQRDRYICY